MPAKREEQVFCEELANDARAGGAESGTDGEFAEASGAAHERKVGDIGAGDEEKKTDGGEQHPKRTPNDFGGIFQHGNDVGAPVSVEVGASLRGEVGDAKHVLLSLGDGDAGFEAGNDCEVASTFPIVGAIDSHWGPNFGLHFRKRETLGHDADDFAGHTVDVDLLADEGTVVTELAVPEFVAENDAAVLAGNAVRGSKNASKKGRDPKGREELRGDMHARNGDGLSMRTEIGSLSRRWRPWIQRIANDRASRGN